jgi:hypothetical protein
MREIYEKGTSANVKVWRTLPIHKMRRLLRINMGRSCISVLTPRDSAVGNLFSRVSTRGNVSFHSYITFSYCFIFLGLRANFFRRSRMGVFFHPGWLRNCPDEKGYLGRNIPSQIPRNSKLTALFLATSIAFETWGFNTWSEPSKSPFSPQYFWNMGVSIVDRQAGWNRRREIPTENRIRKVRFLLHRNHDTISASTISGLHLRSV